MLLLRVSICPLVTIFKTFRGVPFRIIDCGERRQIFRDHFQKVRWIKNQCRLGRLWLVPQSPFGSTACVSRI